MNATSIAANAANIVTIVIGVAFLAVSTVGIAQPIQAQTTSTVASHVAR